MAIDRASAPSPSRAAGGLTLTGLLDVLDRAEPMTLRHQALPVRALVLRSGVLRRPAGLLPTVRPVPVPAVRLRPAARPRSAAASAPAASAGPVPVGSVPTPARTASVAAATAWPRLRARLRELVRRLALWGAGPDGANLAWGRPPAPAPRADGPVLLTELPSTPTIQPAAPSPAAALRPPRASRPVAPPRVPVVAPLARQLAAPRPAPAALTARRERPPGTARASGPARARGDPRPPAARGQPPG